MRRLRFLHALGDLAAHADDAVLLDRRPSRRLPLRGPRGPHSPFCVRRRQRPVQVGVRHASGRA